MSRMVSQVYRSLITFSVGANFDCLDVTFADSQALWTQHTSGAFSQIDLRHSMSMRPIDSVPRTALSWGPTGALAFISDKPNHREVPYDDVYV